MDFDDIDWSQEEPKFPFALEEAKLSRYGARPDLESAARAGEPLAQHDLGMLLLNEALESGNFLGPDVRRVRAALEWLGRAADQNVAAAEYAYGWVVMTVVGLKSIRDAKACFQKGVELGHDGSRRALEWLNGTYETVTTTVRS